MRVIVAAPITLLMIFRAWSHKSLTPGGIFAAALTALAHGLHPWSTSFSLLIVFFLAGTRVTKIKHDIKSGLTVQASENIPGLKARTHVQVLANSAVASVLTILHALQLYRRKQGYSNEPNECLVWPGDPLFMGIIANYAAVTADTFSSELGILSKSHPRLITSRNLRKVPPGTNGGVTLVGLISGMLGSLLITTTTLLLTPYCQNSDGEASVLDWSFARKLKFTLAMTLWGTLGSILDSVLGGWFQRSVVDTSSGKIIEDDGGKAVLLCIAGSKDSKRQNSNKDPKETSAYCFGEQKLALEQTDQGKLGKGNNFNKNNKIDQVGTGSIPEQKLSRVVESGSLALLDNNEVNFVMALSMSVGAILISSWF
ncbi:hypothetical protein K3495_g4592 [Podosphaera aphanis]|nr:hypothetical protein K3495_g4592 [Podosphaera aphanis]